MTGQGTPSRPRRRERERDLDTRIGRVFRVRVGQGLGPARDIPAVIGQITHEVVAPDHLPAFAPGHYITVPVSWLRPL
jgi:hypothetical protein